MKLEPRPSPPAPPHRGWIARVHAMPLSPPGLVKFVLIYSFLGRFLFVPESLSHCLASPPSGLAVGHRHSRHGAESQAQSLSPFIKSESAASSSSINLHQVTESSSAIPGSQSPSFPISTAAAFDLRVHGRQNLKPDRPVRRRGGRSPSRT